MSTTTFIRCCIAAGTLALTGLATAAEPPPVTAATLVDRALIQDLFTDYYAHLGAGNTDFGRWFVEDGVLDVNGMVVKGVKGLEELYQRAAAGSTDRKGNVNVMLSNLKVTVNGDTAEATMLWTEVVAETVTAAPRIVEQGHEHTELVKRGGRWLIRHRVVTSDGGMPAAELKTWTRR